MEIDIDVQRKIQRTALLVDGSLLVGGLIGYGIRQDEDFSREIQDIKENAIIYQRVVDKDLGPNAETPFSYDSREVGAEYWGVDDNCDGDINRILEGPFGVSNGFSYGLQTVIREGDSDFSRALYELEVGNGNEKQ